MVGKRMQFDDETWEAIVAVARQRGRTFQQLADDAFRNLLPRYGQPDGLMAALEQRVDKQRNRAEKRSNQPLNKLRVASPSGQRKPRGATKAGCNS
jgi:hypothetical protein